jgi:hypothetical protein
MAIKARYDHSATLPQALLSEQIFPFGIKKKAFGYPAIGSVYKFHTHTHTHTYIYIYIYCKSRIYLPACVNASLIHQNNVF